MFKVLDRVNEPNCNSERLLSFGNYYLAVINKLDPIPKLHDTIKAMVGEGLQCGTTHLFS